MSIKRSFVEIVHDEGYGDDLLFHVNTAMRGKDMRALRVISSVNEFLTPEGLSLRDSFACAALTSVNGATPTDCAELAYDVADKMLEQKFGKPDCNCCENNEPVSVTVEPPKCPPKSLDDQLREAAQTIVDIAIKQGFDVAIINFERGSPQKPSLLILHFDPVSLQPPMESSEKCTNPDPRPAPDPVDWERILRRMVERLETVLTRHGSPLDPIKAAMKADDDYAWTWFCNIMMLMVDEGVDPQNASQRAAGFMNDAFAVNVRRCTQWTQLEHAHTQTANDRERLGDLMDSPKTDWTVGGNPLAQVRSMHSKIMEANQQGLDELAAVEAPGDAWIRRQGMNPRADVQEAIRKITEPQTMKVCEICGNKRCPHAQTKVAKCTNSNEPGQKPTHAATHFRSWPDNCEQCLYVGAPCTACLWEWQREVTK